MRCINGEMYEGITQIDFMSVDMEGSEMNFLTDFPFKEIVVGVITIEFHPIFKSQHSKITAFLQSKSFEMLGRIKDEHHDYHDVIFVNNEYMKMLKHSKRYL